jgi:hypothetical protein
VCAEEKFKKLKDGSVNRHIYYGCSRSKNPVCQREYINEPNLIEQFIQVIDGIDLNELSVRQKVREEVQRVKRFNQVLLGTKEDIEVKDIDIRNYVKYILKSGSDIEKREMLGCFKNKIILQDKNIQLISY